MTNAMHVSAGIFSPALAAGALTAVLETSSAAAAPSPAGPPQPPDFPRKLKLGIIGCGGRGSWLADLFRKHGGYAIHAVADYFPDRAEKAGDKFAVDASRRFSGLDGYKRLLDSGVEAVVVVNVPAFPCPTRPRGHRGRPPRVCRQAGGHRRARRPAGPGRGLSCHAKEALLPGRLSVADRPGEHRGREANSRGRPGPAGPHRQHRLLAAVAGAAGAQRRGPLAPLADGRRPLRRRDHRKHHSLHQRRALGSGTPAGQRRSAAAASAGPIPATTPAKSTW